MTTQTYTGKLVVIVCSRCGVRFGMDSAVHKARQRDHETFYCTNGCRRYYPQESDVEEAQRIAREAQQRAATARESERFWRSQEEKARHRERAQKAAKTRIKNRIAKGVCPCCKRSFPNLREHMEVQHPDWSEE